MMWDRGYGMMSGWGWIGGLMMLAFWVLVAVGVILLVMWAVRAASNHDRGDQGQWAAQDHGGGHRGQWSGQPHGSGPVQWRGQAGQQGWTGQGPDPGQQAWGQQGPDYGAQQRGGTRADRDEAVEIARRRFAGGELTREQYDDIMKALGT